MKIMDMIGEIQTFLVDRDSYVADQDLQRERRQKGFMPRFFPGWSISAEVQAIFKPYDTTVLRFMEFSKDPDKLVVEVREAQEKLQVAAGNLYREIESSTLRDIPDAWDGKQRLSECMTAVVAPLEDPLTASLAHDIPAPALSALVEFCACLDAVHPNIAWMLR